MPRQAENQLTIKRLPNGRYLLYGYVLGRKIRKRSRDPSALETHRETLLLEVMRAHNALAGAPSLKLTRLTEEQLRDAEAAVEMARGRRLVECVVAAQRILPPVDAVSCKQALVEWLATLKKRKRSARTEDKNELRVEAFLDVVKVVNLVELTPLMIERHVFREGCADFTRLTDGQVLRAWLNFCVKRRWLAVSPFEIDMKDLSATAKPKSKASILSPEQSAALLQAAASVSGGVMLPYSILTTWCMLRDSEAQRTTRDKMKLNAATPVIEVEPEKRRTVRYRVVTVPANVLPLLRAAVSSWKNEDTVPFSRSAWARVREAAGLLTLGKTTRGKRRPLLLSAWQADLARHTGISYLYQKTGDIREVCRQAGNKTEVSFRHYLTLPEEGAADKFYAVTAKLAAEVVRFAS